MIRILQITGRMNRGGAETMIMNLYRALDRDQYQFDFVSFSDGPGDYDEEIRLLGGRIHVISGKSPLARMRQLENFLRSHVEYRIVHCHTLLSNAFHLWAAKRANVPVRIAHSHSTNDNSKKALMSMIYKIWAISAISKNATHFLACGVEASNFLFPGRKNVSVIPNSIDVQHFANIAKENKDYLRKEFQLNDNTLVILQLGRLNQVKNHSFSIQVARSLKKYGVDFRMFFAGQGDLRESLEIQVKREGLTEEVIFLGLRTDVPQLLAGTDVMIMPSLHEGFPVVLVESQAAGTPALISDRISSEVDLNVGLVDFVPLDSEPEMWVEKIVAIKGNERISDSERINVIVEKGFDIHQNTKNLEVLYSSTVHS